MIGLGLGADDALFDFDKIANVHFRAELGPRAQAGVGPEHAVRPDHRILKMTESGDAGAGANLDVLEHAVGADVDGIAKFDNAFENTADVDRDIAPVQQLAAHIETRRIGQTHAGDQQAVGNIALVLAFELGELHLAIDAKHFPLAFRLGGAHRQASFDRQCDDVGQVILTLRIVVLQAAQPVGEMRRRHGHDTGIDLANGLLLRTGILLFDDALHLAGRVTHDATVARRIGQVDGKNGKAVPGCLQQALQGCRRGQRHVAVEHQGLRGRPEL